MKNTRKKNTQSNNKTKKNDVQKCMETFVKKEIKFLLNENAKKIKKLDKKELTDEEHQLLIRLKKKRKKEYIQEYTKSIKRNRCNVNCKNTILEPGLPNQIPKTMRKRLGNNKQLIQDFNDERERIFKNRTNVLVDNFYENVSKKTKNKLIKEGAISHCDPLFIW